MPTDSQILHFSTHTQFGAAIAARRLHDSLVRSGVDSTFYFRFNNASVQGGSYRHYQTRQLRSLMGRLRNRLLRYKMSRELKGRPDGFETFRVARLADRTEFKVPPGAIVHLHFVADFLDYESFFSSMSSEQPIVWTLHDMNPLTGGCHYSWDCLKFTQGCGYCPQLNNRRSDSDLSRFNFRLKQRVLAGKNLHVVGASSWLTQMAKDSPIFWGARSFRTIHYGLDTEQFCPVEQVVARQALGVPEDDFVVCFGAESNLDRRKGLASLVDALGKLSQPVTLLTFGNGRVDLSRLPYRCVHLGYVESHRILALAYSAANVFLLTSLQENLAQTALQSLACGTPVIGYDVGGTPEIIDVGQTGWLVGVNDSDALARAIDQMRTPESMQSDLGPACRQKALDCFSLSRQVQGYLELYNSLGARFR